MWVLGKDHYRLFTSLRERRQTGAGNEIYAVIDYL